MIKTLPSREKGTGSIPGWGAKIAHASWPKTQNRKQTKSVNTLKNGPHKNTLKKKKKKTLRWNLALSFSLCGICQVPC